MHKSIFDMKRTLYLLSFCFSIAASTAQVPNGNFEEWQTVDSIENPVGWATNNYYVGYTPVAKTTDAIEGNFSMKVSSTARDILGTATGNGCAHVEFIPMEEYKYLTASVRIDSMDMGCEVSIRVKQWDSMSGFFEGIGTWRDTTGTNGVVNVALPIEQNGLDTILIEVWAKNHYEFSTTTLGYTEIIIDNLQLTPTVETFEPDEENGFEWAVFPNPVRERVNIVLKYPIKEPCSLILYDLHGVILQKNIFPSLSETSLNLLDYLPGLYFLELEVKGKTIAHAKVTIVS